MSEPFHAPENSNSEDDDDITDTVPIPKPLDPTIQSLGEINSVDANVGLYLKKKYLKQIIAFVIVVIAEIAWFSYMVSTNNLSGGYFYVALLPIVIGMAFWGYIRNKMEDAFMEQFAAANGFSFQNFGLPGNLDGALFSLGHDRAGRDLVIGNFQNLPLKLFNYDYTIGYGKGSHTYYYTIFQLDYPSQLPPIFLQVKGHNFGKGFFDDPTQNDPERIQLEGDFNNFFTVWAKKGFETETLQIFTPEFMEKIQDDWKNFSLEFVGQHLYIYSYVQISTKPALDNMYDLAKYLITKLGPLVTKMQSSLVALEGYYNKK